MANRNVAEMIVAIVPPISPAASTLLSALAAKAIPTAAISTIAL